MRDAAPATSRRDPLARVLEIGLAALVVLAPLPFGAVVPAGRLALEIGAFALIAVWVLRAFVLPTTLPGRWVIIGLLGLLGLGVVQVIPLGPAMVEWASPAAAEIRADLTPPADVLAAEQRILGVDPRDADVSVSLSVDRGTSASALRTGAALVGLLLVAITVAATRGAGVLALALLISASFQGLYGLLILVSGHDKIWHVEKLHYLGSATGTFVNRNHFAGFLAMGLAVGMALVLSGLKKTRREDRYRSWIVEIVGDGSRSLVLGLLLVIGLAGLLASFSRAGTALGLAAVVGTLFVAGRGGRIGRRLVPALLILAVAAVPLMQIGADRLLDRFAQSAEDFASTGSRAQVWGDTLTMAVDFPLVGTGFGTFSAIYPVYRSPEVRHFWAHAHNDLIQAGAEGGLLGIGLLLLVVVPVVVVAVQALTGAKGTLGIGFAAGLLAVLLHGLIDFNFHIPANAAVASILAGTLLGLPWVDRSSSS